MTSNSEKKPVDLGLLEEGMWFDNFHKLLNFECVFGSLEDWGLLSTFSCMLEKKSIGVWEYFWIIIKSPCVIC